jgi:competence protein ComEA
MKRFALLVPFLALSMAQAQDLPEGKGKDLLQKICADCHGLDVIVNMKASKDGWQSVVDSMVGRGASGTKEELDTIVDYLAKNFGEKKLDQVSAKPHVR